MKKNNIIIFIIITYLISSWMALSIERSYCCLSKAININDNPILIRFRQALNFNKVIDLPLYGAFMFDNNVLICENESLSLFDPKTSKRIWNIKDNFHFAFKFDDETIIAVSFQYLHFINIKDGQTIRKIGPYKVLQFPIVVGRNIIFNYGSKSLVCIDENGNKLWSANTEIVSVKLRTDGKSVFISERHSKTVESYDVKSGQRKWIKDLKAHPDNSVFVTEDKVIVPFPASLVCLDAKTGNTLWEAKLPSRIDGLTVRSIILATCSDHTVAIDINSGKNLWMTDYKDVNLRFSESFQFDNHSIIGGYQFLNVVDNKTGKVINKYNYSRPVNLFDYNDEYMLLHDYNENFLIYAKAANSMSFVANSNKIKLDGKEEIFDSKPVNINNITYIPAKYLVEPLGGQIFWNQKTKQIKANLLVPGSETLYNTNPDKYEFKENVLELAVNSNKATLNGKQVQIDPKNPKITPIIINGRTMVPLRFLAESLGCKVEWKADTKEIIVTYQP